MDKILPYTSMVWTMFALSSNKAGPASLADAQAGARVAVASLAIIAGCLLFVVARWLGGFVCDLYERVRQARKPRVQPGKSPTEAVGLRGPLWALSGAGLVQVSRGLLKDIDVGQRLSKRRSDEIGGTEMGEEKETIELTERELSFILDVTRMSREMLRINCGHDAFCSVHDEVERKVNAAFAKIAERTRGRLA